MNQIEQELPSESELLFVKGLWEVMEGDYYNNMEEADAILKYIRKNFESENSQLRSENEKLKASLSASERFRMQDAGSAIDSKWISVNERLPEFVYHDKTTSAAVVGYYEYENKWYVATVFLYKEYSGEKNIWLDCVDNDKVKVIKWMPLPSAPQS